MSLQELYSAANSLEPRDKAELAYNLLAALDAETDEDTTALWVEESERRFAQYLEHGQSISARVFIAEMATKLGN